MKWITRSHVHVDRVACPWLITRFIDNEAQFQFVPASQVAIIASETGAIPFDAKGVELGHHEGRCSFESIILKYDLKDPALLRMAKIVHAADVTEKPLLRATASATRRMMRILRSSLESMMRYMRGAGSRWRQAADKKLRGDVPPDFAVTGLTLDFRACELHL
jgi:hypothetical protein